MREVGITLMVPASSLRTIPCEDGAASEGGGRGGGAEGGSEGDGVGPKS